jgi:hypothetical protein
MTAYEPIPGSILATLTTAALVLAGTSNCCSDDGRLEVL